MAENERYNSLRYNSLKTEGAFLAQNDMSLCDGHAIEENCAFNAEMSDCLYTILRLLFVFHGIGELNENELKFRSRFFK